MAQVIMKTCFELGVCLVHTHCPCFGRRVKGKFERDFISGYQEKPTIVNQVLHSKLDRNFARYKSRHFPFHFASFALTRKYIVYFNIKVSWFVSGKYTQ